MIILLSVGHLPGGVGLDYTTSLLLLPVSLWFLLYIFSGGKILSASLQVILTGSFSVNSIILTCPWEKVSSGSSYSVILATPGDCMGLNSGVVTC